ncbi:MAG TPA: PIN domain-containing protein [Candidatus Woesebacteria bacterium]|jgi:predicted nucleic acid-binding protein|nr:PIN domain-containing protein [Candidatus Shapirobacteria bacterium]HOR02044.1 PIN domain-containing protein [Candidatus Woesebacteria bacterium]
MVKVVIDSSVLIQNIRLGREVFFELVEAVKQKKVEVLVPTVVLMEIWSGKSMNNKSLEKKIVERLAPFTKIACDEKVACLSGEIRRNYGINGLDAIIAATTLDNRAKLLTLNKKHFKMIKELKFYE